MMSTCVKNKLFQVKLHGKNYLDKSSAFIPSIYYFLLTLFVSMPGLSTSLLMAIILFDFLESVSSLK